METCNDSTGAVRKSSVRGPGQFCRHSPPGPEERIFQQHQGHHRKDHRIGGLRPKTGGDGDDETQDKSGKKRSGQISHAADNHYREGDEENVEPHVRLGRGDGRVQHSSQHRQPGPDDKDNGKISIHIEAQAADAGPVLQGGDDDFPDDAPVEESPEPEEKGDRAHKHHDPVQGNVHVQEVEGDSQRIADRLRLGAPDPLDQVGPDQKDCVGGDNGVIQALAVQAADHQALDDKGNGQHRRNSQDQGQWKDFSEQRQEGDKKVHAHGVNHPVGEIDDLHGAESDGKADREKIEDRPDRQAVDEGLKHFLTPPPHVSACCERIHSEA